MTDAPPPGPLPRRGNEALVVLGLAVVLLVAVAGLVVTVVVRQSDVALSNLGLISTAIVSGLIGYVGGKAGNPRTPPPS